MCATVCGRRESKSRRELRDPEEFFMETAQGDGQGADDACSPAEGTGANLHRPRRELQQHARHLVRKIRTRSDRATQNEELRIHSCDDRRSGKSSQPRRLHDEIFGVAELAAALPLPPPAHRSARQ